MLFGTFLASVGVAVPYFTATGDKPNMPLLLASCPCEWKTKVRFMDVGLSVLQRFGHY